jgi:hypothetical protein
MTYVTKAGELTPRAWSAISGGLLGCLFSTPHSILAELQERLRKSMAGHDRDIRECSVRLQALTGLRQVHRGSPAAALFDEILAWPELQREMAQLLPRREDFLDHHVDENFGHAYRIAKERLGRQLR